MNTKGTRVSKSTVFLCVPSLIGIKGNVEADSAAKTTNILQYLKDEISHTCFNNIIKRKISLVIEQKMDKFTKD